MSKPINKTYGDHLTLRSTVEHFYNDLCGQLETELDEILEQEFNWIVNEYISKIKLVNGKTYTVEIYWNEEFESYECNAA